MLHLDLTLEDNRLIISRDEKWRGRIWDIPTGTEVDVCWTDTELSAVLALAAGIGEDQPHSILTKELYAIAEPLFKDIPSECRIIP